MKITFFGTSHGVPEPNRRCSSALVTMADGSNYFVDMGSEATEQLINRGIGVDTVRAVFLTHMHCDHTNGVLTFVSLCSWYFRETSPAVLFPEQAGIDALRGWLDANGVTTRPEIRLETVREGKTYDDGTLRVTAFRTHHCHSASYAYLLEGDGKRVLFTGDLNPETPMMEFPVQTAADRPIDLAVCESAHFDPTRYVPIFAACHPRRVVINHYKTTRIPAIFELMAQTAPLPITIATDNLEVTV